MINVNDYAHLKDDAAMIQAAVDAAQCETVLIPRLNQRTGQALWLLNRGIRLHSGSSVCLENAHLRLADGIFDNMFKNDNALSPEGHLLENRQHDIRIFGIGTSVLDGGFHNGLVERNARGSKDQKFDRTTLENTMIHLQNVERVRVENLRIVNARYWGMTFRYCANGRVADINFMSCGRCPNNDGIDLRVGCHDFVIENISGYTQDDTVALTALRDYDSVVPGLDDAIHNVVIRNVNACTRCAVVRLLNHYGHKLYNIIIENIQSSVEVNPSEQAEKDILLQLPDCERVNWAVEPPYWNAFEDGQRRAHVAVRIGENGYFDPQKPNSVAHLGDTFNVVVRNVQAWGQFGVTIARTLCDSVIENVQMFGDSTGAVHMGSGDFDNIAFRNIGFTRSATVFPSEWTSRGGNYGYERPSAVSFHGAHASNLSFDGVTTHPAGQPAFGGTGDVEMTVRGVLLRGENSCLLDGEGIRIKPAER